MSAGVKSTHEHSDGALTSNRPHTAANSATFLLPHLTPTSSLLDVGCGSGSTTVDFAKLCPEGRVVGVDAAQVIVDAATKERATRETPNLSFTVGDALSLPFEDDSFDIVHCHDVLMHVGDPVGALREMGRVCAPGGLVACRERDLGGAAWAPADARLDELRSEAVAATKESGGDPFAGRHLLLFALEAGFEVEKVTPSSSAKCFSGADTREWWGDMWYSSAIDRDFTERTVAVPRKTLEDIPELTDSWSAWFGVPHVWVSLVHGEIIVKVDGEIVVQREA